MENVLDHEISIGNYRLVQEKFEHIRQTVVQAGEDVNQQWVHIRDRMPSFLMYDGGSQESEDEYQQWMRKALYYEISIGGFQKGFEHIQQTVVQVSEDIKQHNMLSFLMYDGWSQANEDKYQQWMEHILDHEISIGIYRLVQEGLEHIRQTVVQVSEEANQQRVEHIRPNMLSFRVFVGGSQANEDKYQQWMENILNHEFFVGIYRLVQEKFEHIRQTVVQASEDVNQLEHIRDRMLSLLMYDGGSQGNEDENGQEIEHVRNTLSISFDLLKLVENQDQPTPRPEVVKVIKFLHDRGLESARCEVKRDLEKVRTNHYTIPKTVQYVKMYLELMLQMFESVTFQRTICKMVSKAERDQALCKHCKMLQANEGENV